MKKSQVCLLLTLLVCSCLSLATTFSFDFLIRNRITSESNIGVVSSSPSATNEMNVFAFHTSSSNMHLYYGDNRAYSDNGVVQECIGSTDLFNSDTVYEALLANTTIPMSEIRDNVVTAYCAGKVIVVANALTESFLVCSDNTTGYPSHIISAFFVLTVSNFTLSARTMPAINSTFLSSCLPSYSVNLVSFNTNWWRKQRPPLTRQLAPKKYQKKCVFLHGAGETHPANTPTSDSYESYWGKVKQYLPQCNETVFIKEDTVNRGWKDTGVQRRYCDVASGYTGTISNVIIFAHSMGNLILAGAIENGACSMDTSTTKWYASRHLLKAVILLTG